MLVSFSTFLLFHHIEDSTSIPLQIRIPDKFLLFYVYNSFKKQHQLNLHHTLHFTSILTQTKRYRASFQNKTSTVISKLVREINLHLWLVLTRLKTEFNFPNVKTHQWRKFRPLLVPRIEFRFPNFHLWAVRCSGAHVNRVHRGNDKARSSRHTTNERECPLYAILTAFTFFHLGAVGEVRLIWSNSWFTLADMGPL